MKKSSYLPVRIEESMKARLQMVADENLTTSSEIIRTLIRDYLRGNKQLELVKSER